MTVSEIRTVGVVGAGQMGSGIAHVCALAGMNVLLSDVSDAALDKARDTIDNNLKRQVGRDLISVQDAGAALDRLKPVSGLAPLEGAELVIEAATEKKAIKEAIFADLSRLLPANAFMATNTSSISVTGLASQTDRPDRFIGLHFMNPVPVMKLVEIIRGLATSDETYAMAVRVADRLGKTTTNAQDYPAFIVNRILVPMINEAVYALYEGVGGVEAIDTAMRLGANHPMGPLTLGDFIGLDTCLSIMQVLHDGLADTKYRPCPLLVKYVEAGWLGRKTGRGFYDYTGDAPIPTR